MNFFIIIFITYVFIGIFLVGFTHVRSHLIAELGNKKLKSGEPAPVYRVFFLIAIMFALAIFLWPLIPSTWSRKRKPNELYDIIKKNLPASDVPMPRPTAEELDLRRAKYEKENELITIANATFPLPKSFKFEIGGFHGSAHQLRLVGSGELEYKFAPDAYEWEPPIVLTPDHAHCEEFWREMDAVNFWRWQPEYSTDCLDGTHWSVCAEISNKSRQTTGSNGYPGSKDSRYLIGGQFDLFLKAVQKLTGIENIR